jgi:hypothetical protein
MDLINLFDKCIEYGYTIRKKTIYNFINKLSHIDDLIYL